METGFVPPSVLRRTPVEARSWPESWDPTGTLLTLLAAVETRHSVEKALKQAQTEIDE